MVFHEFEHGKADLDIKSGNMNGKGIFGFKLVSWYLENSAKNLLMVGCGALAPYLIAASLLVKPDIKQVVITNPHNPQSAAQRLNSITNKVKVLLEQSGAALCCEIKAQEDTEKAVKASDMIITATPSRQPMIKAEWVQKGTHISCVGADIKCKQEIDENIFADAKAFADDIAQSFDVGECEVPYNKGVITEHCGEIGEVINGTKADRTSEDDITVFDSTGIALQDLSSAAQILEVAEKNNIGTVVEL